MRHRCFTTRGFQYGMERFTIHRALVRSTLKKIRIKEFTDRKLVIQEVFSMP